MNPFNDILKRGDTLDGLFEITFPIETAVGRAAFRAVDADGAPVRIDLVDLARLPAEAFDETVGLTAAARLQGVEHPNLGRYLTSGEVVAGKQRFGFFAFELTGSESLAERLKREGPLPSFKAVALVAELLGGVSYLHARDESLVHNGISPHTVTISYAAGREQPILFGFDNLRSIHDSRGSIALGTLERFYAAPELASGVFVPQSDLFSLGALLFYLITGLPPWYDERVLGADDRSAFKILSNLRKKSPVLVPPPGEAIEQHFIGVIAKCLAIDPSARFQDGEELALALNLDPLLLKPIEDAGRRTKVSPTAKHGVGFAGIAGMEELKATFQNEVIRPIFERERFSKFGIPLLNGILLYGPPGCGKTFIAQRLAEEIGYNFIEIKPSDLASPYVHGGQVKIGELFKAAEEQAPCMIFVDEVDAVIPSRSGDIQHHYAAEVNEFLAQLGSCGEREVFVLAATNKPDKIDLAAIRAGRFDKIVNIPPPDSTLRAAMFRQHLSSRPAQVDIDCRRLAELTKNYVSADIFKIVIEAAKSAEKADTLISQRQLETAIKANPPSVPGHELERYEKLRLEWEQGRSGTGYVEGKSIGFVRKGERQ